VRPGPELSQQVAAELFDGVPNAMFCVKDREGRYTAVNQAFVERTSCRSISEVLGRTAHEVFPPDLAASYLAQDEALLAGGPALKNQLELILRADGSVGWYLTTKVGVVDAGGNLNGIASVSVDLGAPAATPTPVPALAAVAEAVRRRCTENLRVAELADIAGMTVAQLERNMKRVFGLSAKQFVLRTRLELALHLLSVEKMSLADVAARCGYYDQAAFTRQFKRVVGLTPGDYRARARAS
jgi:PAS domain S-box-containing protein